MSYQKIHEEWKDFPNEQTPITADVMAHLDGGLKDLSDNVDSLIGAVGSNNNLTQTQIAGLASIVNANNALVNSNATDVRGAVLVADSASAKADDALQSAQAAGIAVANSQTVLTQIPGIQDQISNLLARIAALESGDGGTGGGSSIPVISGTGVDNSGAPDLYLPHATPGQSYTQVLTVDATGVTADTDFTFELATSPLNGLTVAKTGAAAATISGTAATPGSWSSDFTVTGVQTGTSWLYAITIPTYN